MRETMLSIFFIAVFVGNATAVMAQQSNGGTAADSTAQAGGEGALTLWSIIDGAGGFQYPIFGILVIGLFLISSKIYDLYADQKEAEELQDASLDSMELRRITMLIANQRESMLANIQATMLNVYRTSGYVDTLHEEIANFIQFQRERFETFKRRVDFLSDTAGAIGLLGTVWGIFRVFSGGLGDDDQVLAGMGVALVSTLLGLIVSIVLNLSSTEVYSFFDSRIDLIEKKADELRFRLLELAAASNGASSAPAPRASAANLPPEQKRKEPMTAAEKGDAEPKFSAATVGASQTVGSSTPSAPTGKRPVTRESTEKEGGTVLEKEPIPRVARRAEVDHFPGERRAGSLVEGIRIRLKDQKGDPLPNEEVHVEARDGSGTLDGENKSSTKKTDKNGEAFFDWQLPTSTGTASAQLDVPSSQVPETKRLLEIEVKPGSPARFKQKGNNQGAEVGERLPKPLQVRAEDAYGNPVDGVPTSFAVEMGSGVFQNGEQSITLETDNDGIASALFTVGDEPGFNSIVTSIGDDQLKFQAMGLEE